MILVYTGNGKGKTSACVGQALRARGQGKRVVFGQFFKHPGQAGEQRELSSLLGDDFRAQGPGFCLGERDDINKHKEAAREMLAWAEEPTFAGDRREKSMGIEANTGAHTDSELTRLLGEMLTNSHKSSAHKSVLHRAWKRLKGGA